MGINRGHISYSTNYNGLDFKSFSINFGQYHKQKLNGCEIVLNQGSTSHEYPYFQEEVAKRYKLNTSIETTIRLEICDEGLKFTFDSDKLGGSYIVNYIDITYDTFNIRAAPTYATVPSRFNQRHATKKIELSSFNVKGLREICKNMSISIPRNSRRKDIECLLRKTNKYC